MSYLKDKYPLVLGQDNEKLKIVSEKVPFPFSPKMKDLAEDLMELMREYDGVWLAAPQIWIPIRMIATSQWEVDGSNYNHLWDTVMINPEVLMTSEETIISEEWCLSLPGVTWFVERPAEVRIVYSTIDGKKVEKTYKWFDSIIIMHEMDHLNWILFTDKLTTELPRWEL